MRGRLILLFLLPLFVACSQQSSAPRLPTGSDPLPIERVLLRSELTGKDLRTLFQALNENNQLAGLKPWIEGAPDQELDEWAQLFTEWVYQPALSKKSLVGLTRKRFETKGISTWLSKVHGQVGDEPKLRAALRFFISTQGEWSLAKRYVKGLDENFSALILPKLQREQNEYVPIPGFEGAPPSWTGVASEFHQWLLTELGFQALENLGNLLFEDDAWGSLVTASRLLRKEAGPKGFQAFALGLRKAVTTPVSTSPGANNQIGSALRLAALLNRPAEKPIRALQEGIALNLDLVRQLSAQWNPIFLRAVSSLMWKVIAEPEDGSRLDKAFWLGLPRTDPNGPPTASFLRLHGILFAGLYKITDPERVEGADSLFYSTPLYFNSLALTRWFEELIRTNLSQFQKLNPSSSFQDVSKLELTLPQWEFSLVVPDESAPLGSKLKKVAPGVATDLVALQHPEILRRLTLLLNEEGFGGTLYSFPAVAKAVALEKAFAEAVTVCHAIRPFSDLSPFLTTTAYHFSQSKDPSFINLEGWKELPNLLDALQSLLLGMEKEGTWKHFRDFLFEDLKLGKLEPEQQADLLRLWQTDPEAQVWVKAILDNVQSIYELDREWDGPSLFSFYLDALRASSSLKVPSWSSVLTQLSHFQFFDSSNGSAVYPDILRWLSEGNGPARILYSFSGLENREQRLFGRLVYDIFGDVLGNDSGWVAHLRWTRKWVRSQNEHFLSVASWLSKWGWNGFPGADSLTGAERAWIQDFVGSGQLDKVLRLFSEHGTREGALKVLAEMKALQEKGTLDRVFRLLGQMENERIQELSSVLLLGNRNGQLIEFLTLLQALGS